ncbi:MAG: hypothetical protein KPEEDBHJ_01491 [Anaerolineales bacterium]|nr:hypothetical protein [Anaerolineales bacterium]
MTERSRIQTLIQVFVSAQTFAAMETESRTWKVKCPNCNHERSIWEMGGIRYKAASMNKKMYRACPNCGQRGWHTVYKNA